MTPALPSLVVITDRRAAARAGRPLREVVAAAVDAGAPAILLRDKDLDDRSREELGSQLRPVVAAAGALLFVSSDPALAGRLGADGLHLAAADPPCTDLPDTVRFVGRSCHDLDEVRAADDAPPGPGRRSYAFVSPVAVSASKPGHGPALGPEGLRRLRAAAPDLPMLALGGVTPENAPVWRTAGADGVAVMGGVMGAADPAAAVRALLAGWSHDDTRWSHDDTVPSTRSTAHPELP